MLSSSMSNSLYRYIYTYISIYTYMLSLHIMQTSPVYKVFVSDTSGQRAYTTPVPGVWNKGSTGRSSKYGLQHSGPFDADEHMCVCGCARCVWACAAKAGFALDAFVHVFIRGVYICPTALDILLSCLQTEQRMRDVCCSPVHLQLLCHH